MERMQAQRTRAIPLDGVAALRRSRLFECADLDEARERIAGVLQPHALVPLGRGPRPANHMDVIAPPGLTLAGLAFGHARVEVPVMSGYHLVAFCLSGHAAIRVDGRDAAIGPGQAVTCAPGRSFAGEFSADCEQFLLRIDGQAVRARTGLRAPVLRPQLDLSRPEPPWLDLLRPLVASPALLDRLRSDGRVAASYAGLLLDLLLDGHATNAPRSAAAPAAVRRAEQFMDAHALDALTLQDIARAAGTPPRTLLSGFRRFRATTPMRHLRDLRLDRARQRLLGDGRPGIAAVALECGFGHPGRFAREYAGRFGEAPSRTLAGSAPGGGLPRRR